MLKTPLRCERARLYHLHRQLHRSRPPFAQERREAVLREAVLLQDDLEPVLSGSFRRWWAAVILISEEITPSSALPASRPQAIVCREHAEAEILWIPRRQGAP